MLMVEVADSSEEEDAAFAAVEIPVRPAPVALVNATSAAIWEFKRSQLEFSQMVLCEPPWRGGFEIEVRKLASWFDKADELRSRRDSMHWDTAAVDEAALTCGGRGQPPSGEEQHTQGREGWPFPHGGEGPTPCDEPPPFALGGADGGGLSGGGPAGRGSHWAGCPAPPG